MKFPLHAVSIFMLLPAILLSCQTSEQQGTNQAKHLKRTITISLPNLPKDAKPLKMRLIPPGTYQMGCPADERSAVGREWPPHMVTISKAFYLGVYEVTQAQWHAVMGTRPAKDYGTGNNHPIYNVTWNDGQAFMQRLNELGQGRFRLPTEAEWEYACRAGTTTRFSFGDALECNDIREYEPLLDRYMWWGGNNGKQGYAEGTKEVGLKLPNPWGLYDIHGNVWEWCADWWETASHRGPQIDPQGPETGTHKVMRGGAWESHALHLRSADRSPIPPDSLQYGRLIGLRLARDYP
ncbi:SUMF1/EgtB/PvdO family nonheme iron enzyme [bacterium]|nr:SUMF1/EgtB/PvdO family nonheme iron enzyme [bacterium]